MKKIMLSLISCLALTVCAQEKFIRPTVEMYPVKNFSVADGLKNPAWSGVKEYPMMLNAAIPQEFGVLPREEGKVQLMYDKENIYIRAIMLDSEVISEAVDKNSPLPNCADNFYVILRPLNETGFFYLICTPNAIMKATFVHGAGSMRLESANMPLKSEIKVYTAINGKINDSKRDKSWSIFLALPINKMMQEVRKSGFNVNESRGFSFMAGRKNFSRFLEMIEISGYPQPVRGFFNNMHHHAKLVKR